MDIDVKQLVLQKMYAIYSEFVSQEPIACKAHCAYCCTRNVTMTTLEGYYLLNQVDPTNRKNLIDTIKQQSHRRHFIPQVTINRMADLCARDQELPEEENDANWGQCPVLDQQLCPIYPLRPFACRSMLSRQNCGQQGYADLPAWVVSANNVIQQYIEHIDAKGFSGNFTDILLFLDDPVHFKTYAEARHLELPPKLLANQPVFVLMIPPEDRDRIAPLLHSIRNIRIEPQAT